MLWNRRHKVKIATEFSNGKLSCIIYSEPVYILDVGSSIELIVNGNRKVLSVSIWLATFTITIQ